jgi:hypothetical protein
MADPRTGVAATHEFFSLAAVHKWLANFGPQPVWKPFKPEPEWTPPTPEERAACVQRAREAKALITDTTERMRTEGKITGKRAPAPRQVDDPDLRERSMVNLEAINGKGAEQCGGQ